MRVSQQKTENEMSISKSDTQPEKKEKVKW